MPQSDRRAEQKKNVLTLVAFVVVLHGAMIGAYYVLGIAGRAVKTQQAFAAVWIVLTLIVVTTMMRRVRKARRRR